MNRPLVVGVTGGIGSGKSTACRIFNQLGVPVYYADDQGKYLLNTNSQLKAQVIDIFGVESYTSNGTLNRAYLASRVFSDQNELNKLNKLVHPAVAKNFKEWVDQHGSTPIVIKEAALLIENESYKLLDKLITVLAPQKVRIERVLLRDTQRSKTQVEDIIENQIDDKIRSDVSDYLIDNSGIKLLIPQILEVYKKLRVFCAT